MPPKRTIVTLVCKWVTIEGYVAWVHGRGGWGTAEELLHLAEREYTRVNPDTGVKEYCIRELVWEDVVEEEVVATDQ
jgi:hypothetical protein